MNVNMKLQKLVVNIPMVLGLVLGLLFFTFQIVGYKFDYFPGDLVDGRLNLYFLEHVNSFFTGKISSLWDAPFMYPEKNVLAISDNLLGSAPVYMFFRLFGLDIYNSYILWFMSVTILNYLAAFYFLNYLLKDNFSAALGAFTFAFCIALQSQLTHAQTFPRFAIPMAFLMGVKFDETLNPKFFFLTLLMVVYQIYCGIYLGFMLAVSVGVFLFLILLRSHNRQVWHTKWLLLNSVFLLASFALLLPLMLPYMERKRSSSTTHYYEILETVPTPISHIYSHKGSLIWGSLSEIGKNYNAWYDHQIFAGGIATICLLVAFIMLGAEFLKVRLNLKSMSIPMLLICVAFITFILYLRFSNESAYYIVYQLPGFSAMRSMTRIINIELLFFSIAVATVFSKLFQGSVKTKSAWFTFAMLLVVVDNYAINDKLYRTPVETAKERTREIEPFFACIPRGSAVSYEPKEYSSVKEVHVDAMLVTQKFQLKTVNGYTAISPDGYGMFWNQPNALARNYWLFGKSIDLDTLYVIKGPEPADKVSLKEIETINMESARRVRLEQLIRRIRNDQQWMQSMEKKAKERNQPIDSVIVSDAKWIIEHEKQ